MIEHACPANKHYEDWDLEGLSKAYEAQFGIECTGVSGFSDRLDLAEKLFADANGVLTRKLADIGPLNYLRFFRNVYMQEIDRQWIQHLSAMDHLRDGIGLRGYGQRDPKREYKREGYELFLQMMQSIEGSVAALLFRAQRVQEEDLRRQEADRKQTAEARLRGMRASHAEAAPGRAGAPSPPGEAPAGGPASGPNRRQRRRMAAKGAQDTAAPPAAEAQPHTVVRDRPKVGRNDPCWCGSGKKYKNCHYREDQAAAV